MGQFVQVYTFTLSGTNASSYRWNNSIQMRVSLQQMIQATYTVTLVRMKWMFYIQRQTNNLVFTTTSSIADARRCGSSNNDGQFEVLVLQQRFSANSYSWDNITDGVSFTANMHNYIYALQK